MHTKQLFLPGRKGTMARILFLKHHTFHDDSEEHSSEVATPGLEECSSDSTIERNNDLQWRLFQRHLERECSTQGIPVPVMDQDLSMTRETRDAFDTWYAISGELFRDLSEEHPEWQQFQSAEEDEELLDTIERLLRH